MLLCVNTQKRLPDDREGEKEQIKRKFSHKVSEKTGAS
jgi:hypothetical protein